MTTRAAASAATCDHLLGAAVDELLAVGGDSFSMQGVARRSDVALRTLYNYFPSREELLAATFVQLANRTRRLVGVVDMEAAGTPVEQLRRLVERIFQLFEDEGEPLTTLLALRGVPQLDDAVAEVRAWRRERLTGLLHQIDRDHGLAMPLAEAAALAFALTAHTTWHSLAVQSGLSTQAAQRVAADALVSAIVATPRGAARGAAATTTAGRKR